jgi:hypothetical protein
MKYNLQQELERAGLPASWEDVIERVSSRRMSYPSGASLSFAGGKRRMDVAFRAMEDHFVVYDTSTPNPKHLASFSLDHNGLQVSYNAQHYEKHAEWVASVESEEESEEESEGVKL